MNERGLTSRQWSVYNTDTKRIRYSSIPTSNITAEAVTVDSFAVSQKDTSGIVTTATRRYTATGMELAHTDGRGNTTTTVTDTAGRATCVTDAQGTTTAYCPCCDQPATVTDALGRSSGYTYAKDGTTLQTVTTGYGADGRINSAGFLHGGAAKQFSYEYLPGTNLLQKLTLPSNMTLTQEYEPKRDLLTSMLYRRSNTGIAHRSYTYDTLGRPLTRTTSRNNATVTDTFGYNTRSELTSAQVNNAAYAYDYDNIGNRAAAVVDSSGVASRTDYLTNNLNQYTMLSVDDLTRAAHPALWLITWDATQPVATRPLAIQKDGTWYTYDWDLTKNICELYGQHGYIRTAYTYTPYGQVTAEGDVTQPIQWSSEYNDTELGLVYYNYRHYNPTDGRWIGRDIINSNNMYKFLSGAPYAIDILGGFPFYLALGVFIYVGTVGYVALRRHMDDLGEQNGKVRVYAPNAFYGVKLYKK